MQIVIGQPDLILRLGVGRQHAWKGREVGTSLPGSRTDCTKAPRQELDCSGEARVYTG